MNSIVKAQTLSNMLFSLSKKGEMMREDIDFEKSTTFGASLIAELGDYAPFIYELGRITHDSKLKEWALEQARLCVDTHQLENGLFAQSNSAYSLQLVSPKKMDDLVLGLELLYAQSKEKFLIDSLENFYSNFFNTKAVHKNKVVTAYLSPLGIQLPIVAPVYAGLLLEEAVHCYKQTKNPTFLQSAKKLQKGLVSQEFFQKHGLFGFEALSFKPFMNVFLKATTGMEIDTARLMKNNTNACAGLLAYAKASKDKKPREDLRNWIKNAKEKFVKNGFFSNFWTEKKGASKKQSLEMNHAALDCFLDCAIYFEDTELLKFAENIVNNWVSKKSRHGLFSEGTDPKQKITLINMDGLLPRRVAVSANVSRLDSQVDFAVLLGKFYYYTKNEKYLKEAKSLSKAIYKHHKKGKRLVELIDLETMQPLDAGHFQTKFLALMMKPYLMLHAMKSGKIDERFWSLMRDR